MKRMRRLALVFVVLAAGTAFLTPGASAARRGYPITLGEHTKQTCDAQWLLRAALPSHYRTGYYRVRKGPVVRDKGGLCKWSRADGFATRRLKFRLGFGGKLNGRFTGELRSLLLGKWRRPNKIQHAAFERQHPPKTCDVSDRVVRIARGEVGQREVPWGSNYGPRVAVYEATTGAYHAAWCASFAQTILKWAGLGPVADRSAGVGYIAEYARRHGWLRNDVEPGYLITWGSRHMGIIDSVTRVGGRLIGFYTIEGNASNQVMRRFYRYGLLGGWLIKVPGLDRKIRCGT